MYEDLLLEAGIVRTEFMPTSRENAVKALRPFIGAESNKLKKASKPTLLRAWNALAYLFPGLNPEDGTDRSLKYALIEPNNDLPKSLTLCYAQSGWPIMLIGLLDEMWRRYEAGELTDTEFYCADSAKLAIVERWAMAVAG